MEKNSNIVFFLSIFNFTAHKFIPIRPSRQAMPASATPATQPLDSRNMKSPYRQPRVMI